MVNDFVARSNAKRVVEFGCGDGNQLTYMNYPEYLGFDVAPAAVARCAARFAHDSTRAFAVYDPGATQIGGAVRADLVVCLDVLYHITKEGDFQNTLWDIFSCGATNIALYTKITGPAAVTETPSIRDRDIVAYLDRLAGFNRRIVPQRYPGLSSASFILLEASS